MKVVLVNTYEQRGGAAIACKRLLKSLQKKGVDVKMLVSRKCSDDSGIVEVNDSWWKRKLFSWYFIWERWNIWKSNGFSKKHLFSVSTANYGMNICRIPEVREADVIHLHWINLGFLSLKDLENLRRSGKKIVWTTHDMWPFTGICHYAGECLKYQIKCECCPMLGSKNKRDLSYRIWRKKSNILPASGIVWVGCSRWITGKARTAHLSEGMEIFSIPNPIDTERFCRKDQKALRDKWKLPQDKKLLLFGADRIDDRRKGFTYLAEALKLLAARYSAVSEEVELIVFGRLKQDLEGSVPFKLRNVGYVSDTESMIEIYNCADLFIIPSLEDNLPNTVMESMACGTPVVGFDTGGIPEMIDHQINGYVAGSRNSEDLMKGIYWILFEADRHKLSEEASKKVKECYSEEKISSSYLQLYEQLCRKN